MKKTVKLFYILLSLIFVALAVIGVVLPMLPTTLFLLLASFFALRGSTRFNDWLTSRAFYKKHIATFTEEKGMTIDTKVKILVLASIMLGAGFYFSNSVIARTIIVVLVVIKYYFFIFHIRTLPKHRVLKGSSIHD